MLLTRDGARVELLHLTVGEIRRFLVWHMAEGGVSVYEQYKDSFAFRLLVPVCSSAPPVPPYTYLHGLVSSTHGSGCSSMLILYPCLLLMDYPLGLSFRPGGSWHEVLECQTWKEFYIPGWLVWLPRAGTQVNRKPFLVQSLLQAVTSCGCASHRRFVDKMCLGNA